MADSYADRAVGVAQKSEVVGRGPSGDSGAWRGTYLHQPAGGQESRRSRSSGNRQLSQRRALSHPAAGPCATLGCLWALAGDSSPCST
jgi:hypothetical protein